MFNPEFLTSESDAISGNDLIKYLQEQSPDVLQRVARSASPEIQETPSQVNNAPMNARPNLINKDQFRFEYDPSREAAERREQVKQAILCAACGVALGIPDIRPIKVTCPACMYETTYQQ